MQRRPRDKQCDHRPCPLVRYYYYYLLLIRLLPNRIMQYIYIRKPDLRYSFDVSTWVGKPFATDFFSQQKNRNYAKLYCREIFPAGRHRTQRRLIVTEPVVLCLYMLRSINYTAAIEAHHNKRTIINYRSSIPSLCYCDEFSKETFRQPALSRVNDDKKKKRKRPTVVGTSENVSVIFIFDAPCGQFLSSIHPFFGVVVMSCRPLQLFVRNRR